MKNKQTSLESKIRSPVPNSLLQVFDEAIQGTFSSRNAAIRRGMHLVLKEIEQINAENRVNAPCSPYKQLSRNNASMRQSTTGSD